MPLKNNVLEIKGHKIHITLFNLGMWIVGIGVALFTFCTGFELGLVCGLVSALVFLAGVLIFFLGCIKYLIKLKKIPDWIYDQMREALRLVPPEKKIEVLQTWLPKMHEICPVDIIRTDLKTLPAWVYLQLKERLKNANEDEKIEVLKKWIPNLDEICPVEAIRKLNTLPEWICCRLKGYLKEINPDERIEALKTWIPGLDELCPLTIPKWDSNLIFKTLRDAPENSLIRILQTWIPDYEDLRPTLEDLLIRRGKRFRFEILLMNSGPDSNCDDLVKARILLRNESLELARENIRVTVCSFKKLKRKVDEAWERQHLPNLNLKIRLYEFLPFGPIYQIGESYLFVGFYINYDSSVAAPMLIIRDPSSSIWKKFLDDFSEGWNRGSTEITLGES